MSIVYTEIKTNNKKIPIEIWNSKLDPRYIPTSRKLPKTYTGNRSIRLGEGEIEKLYAIDIDIYDPVVKEYIFELFKKHTGKDNLVYQESPSGGKHILFACTENYKTIIANCTCPVKEVTEMDDCYIIKTNKKFNSFIESKIFDLLDFKPSIKDDILVISKNKIKNEEVFLRKIIEPFKVELRGQNSLLAVSPSKVINKLGEIKEYKLYGDIDFAPVIDSELITSFIEKILNDPVIKYIPPKLNLKLKNIKRKNKHKKKHVLRQLIRKGNYISKYDKKTLKSTKSLLKKDSIHNLLMKFKIKYKEYPSYLSIGCPFHAPDLNYSMCLYKNSYLATDHHDQTIYTLSQVLKQKDPVLYHYTLTKNKEYFKQIFNKKTTKIKVNKWLSEKKEEICNHILGHKHTIIVAPTGVGKTKLVIKDLPEYTDKRILVLQSLMATNSQTSNQYEIPYIDGFVCENEVKTMINNGNKVITTTYEGLKKVTKCDIDFNNWIVIMDEAHNLLTSNDYRFKALKFIMECKEKFPNFVYLTGTHYGVFGDDPVIEIEREHNPFENTEVNVIAYEKKLEAIYQIVKQSKNKTIVLLNNRNDINMLTDLIRKKINKSVGKLNRDLKHTDIYKHIIKHNCLPENLDILFTTQVIAEGISINDKGYNIVMLSQDLPHLQKQFLSRFRHGCDKIYVLYRNNKELNDLDNYTLMVKDRIKKIKKYCNLLSRHKMEAELVSNIKFEVDQYKEEYLIALKKINILNKYIIWDGYKYIPNQFQIRLDIMRKYYRKIYNNPFFLSDMYKSWSVGEQKINSINIEEEITKELKEKRATNKKKIKNYNKELAEKIDKNEYVKVNDGIHAEKNLILATFEYKKYSQKPKHSMIPTNTLEEYYKNNNHIIDLKMLKNYVKLHKMKSCIDEQNEKDLLKLAQESTRKVNNKLKIIKHFVNRNIMEKVDLSYIAVDISFYEYRLLEEIREYIADKDEYNPNDMMDYFLENKPDFPLTKTKLSQLVNLVVETKQKTKEIDNKQTRCFSIEKRFDTASAVSSKVGIAENYINALIQKVKRKNNEKITKTNKYYGVNNEI